MITDLSVNLKAKNTQNEVAYRLLPKTLASNVSTSAERQFVSELEKAKWNSKIGAGDEIDADTINEMFYGKE